MLSARLRERVPSAHPIGIGQLKGHSLRWHKRSNDRSGKFDAEATGNESDVVLGILFEVDRSEKRNLDAAEGLSLGYDEKQVEIHTATGLVKALMYYATEIDPLLRPYHWYKALVLAGAREHGLPVDYIRELEAIPSIPDPDPVRAARYAWLLSGY